MTDEVDTEDGQLTLTYESLKIQGLARYPDSGLRGGSSLTCTFSSAVDQTEINTGTKSAGAQVTAWYEGEPGNLSEETSDETMVDVVLKQDPLAGITKTFVFTPAREDGMASVDDTIAYTITASNDGNVDLSDITLTDERFLNVQGGFDMNWESANSSGILPGAELHCYPTTAITQADIDAGVVASNVTITASAPLGAFTTATALASTTLLRSSGLVLEITTALEDGDGERGTSPGDSIEHEMTVVNTGTVTLTHLSVVDSLLSIAESNHPDAAIVCTPSLLGLSLAPGAEASCSAFYPVSQDDVNAGVVSSEATVSADSPIGPVSVSNSSESQSLEQVDGIDIEIVGGVDNGADGVVNVGDEVTLAFTVTNTGNTCLGNVVVDDPSPGTLACSADFSGDDLFCPLDGHAFTCTAVVYVTQENMNNGHIDHDVGVTAKTAIGDEPLDDQYRLHVPLEGKSAFFIEHTSEYLPVDGIGAASALGDEIAFTLNIDNNGTVTLSSVTPVSSKVELTCEPDVNSGAKLDAGEGAVCAGTYVVTQDDIDAGKIVCAASVTATDPDGGLIFLQTRISQDLSQNPQLSVVLSSVHTINSQDGKTRKGDTVLYTTQVFNSGNTCLSDVQISELLVGGALDCGSASRTLCPTDEAISCTGTHTLTQANVDSVHIINTATATASPLFANTSDESNTISAGDGDTVSWLLYPAISVGSSASLESGAKLPFSGDNLGFTFTLENKGTSSLTSVSLEVLLLERSGTIVDCTPSVTEALALAPGGIVLCSATLELTQDHIDGGALSSEMFARGVASDGQAVLGEASVHLELVQDVGLSVVAIGAFNDENGDELGDAGETMSYTATFRNIGNVRVGNARVSHLQGQSAALACDSGFEAVTSTDGLGELLPGIEFECRATYSLTQADVDAAEVVNTASISGVARDTSGTEVEAEDSWKQEYTQQAIALLNVVGVFHDVGTVEDEADIHDKMEYTVEITNTGTVTLTDVGVTGSLFENEAIPCPGATLAPAESMVCNASYTITNTDIDRYEVETTADVTASGPFAQAVGDSGEYLQRLDAQPSVSLTMQGVHVDSRFDGAAFAESDGNGVADPGEYTRYTMVVRNTGMLTVNQITVVESLKGAEATCPKNHLELAESMVCNATYPLTQASHQEPAYHEDVDRGDVTSVTTLDAFGPSRDDGEARSTTRAEDSSWVRLPQDPSILVTKECAWQDGAESDGLPDPGEVVILTYTVSNTGSVTLTDGSLQKSTDSGLQVVDCMSAIPSAGNASAVVCTSSIEISQADIDAGTVTSTAEITALSPLGYMTESTTNCSWAWGVLPAQVDTVITGRFVDGDGDGIASVGEGSGYNVTIVNNGKVTVTVVEVDATAVARGSSSSGNSASGVTIVCEPLLDTSPLLAPGKSLECTAEIDVDQDDVNRGEIELEFEVTADNPAGDESTVTDSSSIELPAKYRIALSLEGSNTTSSDRDDDGKSSSGDEVTFTLTVANRGSVDLTGVAAQVAGLEGLVCQQFIPSTVGQRRLTWAETNTDQDIFPPEEEYTCTASHILTQDDVDAGTLYRTASVSSQARDPTGTLVVAGAEVALALVAYPSIVVVIVGTVNDPNSDKLAEEGETVAYDVIITNKGNVRVGDFHVLSEFVQNVTCAKIPLTLDPGVSFSCSGNYVLTQRDIDQGVVTNEVIVKAQDPSKTEILTSDLDSVSLARSLKLVLQKTSSYVEGATGSDTIEYLFEASVSNRGTTTLVNVSVTDAALAGEILCPTDTLPPGGSMTCNSSEASPVTTKDLHMGSIVNTASVAGRGPREDDPTITDRSTVTTFTPSGGDNPVALSYTSVSVVSAEISRRRLQQGEQPCGIEAIIAACNEAFGVSTCECINHSDGGCPVPLPDTAASNATIDEQEIEGSDQVGQEQEGARIEDAEDMHGEASNVGDVALGTPPPELATTEVGADGRLLQATGQAITTDMEMKFVTDVESTGAMKAAAALDSFSNVTHGFAALLIGECFEDVIISTVNISQRSNPLDRRVPRTDLSSTSYKDHIEEPLEIVPSALDLTTRRSDPYMWIVIFVLTTVLATSVCAVIGVKCIDGGYFAAGAAHTDDDLKDGQDGRAIGADGSVPNAPGSSPAYSKNSGRSSRRESSRRMSAKEKREARNACNVPGFAASGKSTEDIEVLSSASELSSTGGALDLPAENPLFASPMASKSRHVPRLSGLDFGKTIDEDTAGDSDVASEFWRRSNRGGDDSH
ncbi:unnamed protein product [Ectocarpus sp. 13 AM-2016]